MDGHEGICKPNAKTGWELQRDGDREKMLEWAEKAHKAKLSEFGILQLSKRRFAVIQRGNVSGSVKINGKIGGTVVLPDETRRRRADLSV